MLIAGLTGGIATGKSLVAGRFTDNGAGIIDADKIAHDVVRPGRPAWQEIVDCFGRQYLLPDDTLDRKALGDAVFSDPDQKEKLNRIVHPRVFAEISRQIQKAMNASDAAGSVTILDVPLLFESGLQQNLAATIVVYTDPSTQLRRLMNRDNSSKEAALARINAQMPLDRKKALADFLIDNNGPVEKTWKQVDDIYATLKTKAAAVVDNNR